MNYFKHFKSLNHFNWFNSLFFVVLSGTSEFRGSGRSAGSDPAVGQARDAGQSGLRAADPASADGHPTRSRPGHLPQRPGLSPSHG